MPFVEGGSKVNLIESYLAGEDGEYQYGNGRWLAETFTLDEETVVWRCVFKMWTNIGGRLYHFHLRATDVSGKPTGPDLAHTQASPTGETFNSPGKWKRFDFDTFPKLPAGKYALITSIPTSPSSTGYQLRADTTAPAYARGKAWVSNNSGVTWSEILNYDFLFMVWGYHPPPEPPPTPAISNWLANSITQTILPDGFRIILTTDIPCHLYMRWTLIEPEVHKIPTYRRGIALPADKRFCFVAWEENEQEEIGDTTTHTFTKLDWPLCQTRWFYFVGTRAMEQQPSVSPIFKKHRTHGYLKRAIAASSDDCSKKKVYDVWKWSTITGLFDVGKHWWYEEAMGGGMRFLNIDIPKNAIIYQAWCTMWDSAGNLPVQFRSRWRGQLSPNPATFSTMADYNARPRTSTYLNFDGPLTRLLYTWNDMRDITPIIQEIMSQPLWIPGNPIVIFWDDHEERSGPGWGCYWNLESYDTSPPGALAPYLNILYLLP